MCSMGIRAGGYGSQRVDGIIAMTIPWHPQTVAALIDIGNLVLLSQVMKSSDMLLLSATTCQCGRLVIELVEHGTEVTMVGSIGVADPRSREFDMTNLVCLRQVPARHAKRASSRCVTMEWLMGLRRVVDVSAPCS